MEEKQAAYALLEELKIPEETLRFVEMHGFLTRLDLGRYCLQKRQEGRSDDQLREEIDDLFNYYRLEVEKPPFCALPASSFTEPERRFLWRPYLPEGEFTVLMAPGGTGKTFFVCALAAAISKGAPLPGETKGSPPARVLLISAEDEGGTLRTRLEACGAELENVMLIDCQASQGLCLYEDFEAFRATVLAYQPKLLAVDPWHAFLGAAADMNRANTVRPVFQLLANLCKEVGCAMLLVAHVNKRVQTENLNNAAMGSADLVNAARSALYLLRDPEDRDCRVAVHSKSNYAEEGESLRLRIADGGASFEGYSDVSKEEVEAANRQHKSLKELRQSRLERERGSEVLTDLLEAKANPFAPVRMSYEELRREHGNMVFGGRQPKTVLDACREELERRGIYLRTGIKVKQQGKSYNGFSLQMLPGEPEQTRLSDGVGTEGS